MTRPLTQAMVASAPLTSGPVRYGAIVVGGGASGGLAAMLLTQAGFNVLVA